ncbi:FMN-binding glutamate synthase family protein [Flavobacterium yafengii]|uniref:FMN-binding glutamate synthase family protein n=1 Tax=Flavobacterium yafengii TaxID=3041253 RepID=UPI0024A9CAAA|nr:FMN-binding glutamate synthase family protein [Flavobacterium yafengii]MDI5897430.1 FMN-binding glutamate synthase family protein [Flavobacterium yafengii]
MFLKKLAAHQIIWASTLSFLVISSVLIYFDYLDYLFLVIPLLLVYLLISDTFQSKHTVKKNYPIVGRFRYFLESFRPEMRQYFFEGELDGKPFNRRQRTIVYQRAKNVKQTISFGMQDDPNRIGYEWAAHSIYPKRADKQFFRTTVGNSQCLQPYSASIYNISAMSYGALSKTAISSLNKGAQKGGFAHNTGEGGISDFHLEGGDLIWQIGTGYFGCRKDDGTFSEELFTEKANFPQVKMIELKLSQGAKPGHGGLLPGEKNTPEIAKIRNIQPHIAVHSPAGHTAFSNSTELLLFLKKLRHLSNGKPVGFKICIGRQDEFIDIIKAIKKTGIVPDFITIDGAEGGTGAAPLEFIDYMGMALSDALIFVAKTLQQYELRDQIKIMASGKIITGFDIAKAISLGADACYSARGMMFALGCIQALQCDSGKCPVGIATQDKALYKGLDITEKSVRVAHFHNNTLKAFAEFIGACGFDSPKAITPDVFYRRIDHKTNESFTSLFFNDFENKAKTEKINLN